MDAPDISAHDMRNNMRITIENVMRSWQKKWPWEVADFLKEVEEKKAYLLGNSGMSQGGTLMVAAQMHPRLDAVMMSIFGANWMTDRDVIRSFYDVCSRCRIKPNFQPWRSKSAQDKPTIRDGYQIKPESIEEQALRAMQECKSKSPA